MQMSGNITYCGHQLSEFIPQRTCAYIGPNNLHTGEMTMRETLDFLGRCLGVGPRHNLLLDILKMEKEGNGYMNATTLQDKETNLITDCVLKVCLIKSMIESRVIESLVVISSIHLTTV